MNGALNGQRAALVRDYPMELCAWQLLGKSAVDKIDIREELTRLGQILAQPQYIRNKLVRRQVYLVAARFAVMRVIHEIQPRHSKTLFVHSLIIQRYSVRDMRHSYHRVMPRIQLRAAES